MPARTYIIGHILVSLALADYSYTRFSLPGCWRWHSSAVRGGKRQRSEWNRVASCQSFPNLPGLSSLEFLNGGHVHELCDEGHGGCFLHVHAAFHGASSGTGPDLDPGDGTAAGQRLLRSS